MRANDWKVQCSERFYAALLSLYPVGFRVRFGAEMSQVFRASLRRAAIAGWSGLIPFWVETVKDLVVSISQVQGQELTQSLDADHPLVAFVDSLLVPGMIVMNLVVLGPLITALFAGAAAESIPPDAFMTISVIVSLVLGTLGILRALIVARLRPTVRLWVKLS